MEPPISHPTLQSWKSQSSKPSPFLLSLPKLELHVHLEGTLTPSLRFKFAKRNNIQLHSSHLDKDFHTIDELHEAYNVLQQPGPGAFFAAYEDGMEVLRTEEDFYELAMSYFERAKEMGVRYCEVMVNVQRHTRRGVGIEVIFSALRRAREGGEEKFNVKSSLIVSFVRTESPSSALEHYELVLPYRNIIVGIGLDGSEEGTTPMMFNDVLLRARKDGFKISAHCNVKQPDALASVRQVVSEIGGTGVDRLDHGIDAANDPELVQLIKEKGLGMTLCPWAYVGHLTESELFGHIRTLKGEGVKISIGSDDPAYNEDTWVLENLALVNLKGGWTDEELLRAQRRAVEMCWASEDTKRNLNEEIERFCRATSGK
ncbi:related to AAH1-adenosine deaminase [Phialocephala subalpina]|uniref:Adenosine deaminase n=1 Tax=Phialocephala subalpina TaxID=576137 RepID=A0A1L7WZC2_9HELO|nr:related to AAH1-adenosine deaminase [Phialocephala subalpina]